MTRDQYMILLRAELVGKMPEGELEDILRYYNEYIEEAGPEHERDVLLELGSPERLAQKILGEVPQPEAPNPGVNFDYDYQPQSVAYEPQYNGPLPPWAFIAIAVCVGIVLVPLIGGLALGLGIAGIACIAAGVWVAMGGFVGGFAVGGLALKLYALGGGIMVMAVGMLLIFLTAHLVQGVIKLCRKLWFRYVVGNEEVGYYEEA